MTAQGQQIASQGQQITALMSRQPAGSLSQSAANLPGQQQLVHSLRRDGSDDDGGSLTRAVTSIMRDAAYERQGSQLERSREQTRDYQEQNRELLIEMRLLKTLGTNSRNSNCN